MLTQQEALAEYDFKAGMVRPDRLNRISQRHYLPLAEKLLKLYRESIGCTRRSIHQRAMELLDTIDDCPQRRSLGLIKLLDDVSHYTTDRGRKAAKLRQQVFRIAASQHPLLHHVRSFVGSDEQAVKQQIASTLKRSWSQIERELFVDIIDFHPLKAFDGYPDAAALLARYNVAQVQASLYRAIQMTIWAKSDLKIIARLIKLSQLMHTIERKPDGQYQFTIDGPTSLLRQTRRYGVSLAKMIPSLLACEDWRLVAPIAIGRKGTRLLLLLSPADGLSSSKEIEREFDSEIEADLMKKWEQNPLPDWELKRESELLVKNQKVFTPDFVARGPGGKVIYIEVVGFWTPEYLNAKWETLRQFHDYPILVIVQQQQFDKLDFLKSQPHLSLIPYKTKIKIDAVRQAIISM